MPAIPANSSASNKYILQNGTYLSHSFDELPNGRIDKRVTGIGATYLEITSKRNSIIVEPLKAIASLKADRHKDDKNIATIYIGSETKLHPESINNKDLYELIKKHRKDNKFIKILVVADSLSRVIDTIGNSVYAEYFLAIDEIDTFQSDSSYRARLEKTMDYYFKFDKACVLSATLKSFSNPKLQEQPLTIYDYKEKEKKDINIINTAQNNIDNEICKIIKDYFDTGEKILIAYNYVLGILNVINMLPKNIQSKCSILCSANSKKKVGDYYQEFDENYELAKPITFMTSAYYSGIDIQSKCHLVCIANGSRDFTTLSIDRIRQIHGRLRNKESIISNHLIYCRAYPLPEYFHSLDKLKEYAGKTIKSLECVQHVYSNDKASGKLMSTIRGAISQSAKIKGYGLVRDTHSGKNTQEPISVLNRYEIAYFNIDALLEKERTIQDIYISLSGLKENLQEYYNIKNVVSSFPKDVDNSSLDLVKKHLKSVKAEEIETAFKYILENVPTNQIVDKPHKIDGVTSTQKDIYFNFNKIVQFVGTDNAIQHLRKAYINNDGLAKRDNREVKNLVQAIIFHALTDDHFFKKIIFQAFPLEVKITKFDILSRINNIYARMDTGFGELRKPTQAIRQLKLYFKIIKTRQKDKDKNVLYKIDSINPKNIDLIKKYGSDLTDNEMFSGISVSEDSLPQSKRKPLKEKINELIVNPKDLPSPEEINPELPDFGGIPFDEFMKMIKGEENDSSTS